MLTITSLLLLEPLCKNVGWFDCPKKGA